MTFDEVNGWAHITVTGAFNADIALSVFREAVAFAHRHRCRLLFMDTRHTRAVGSYESGFMLSKHFAQETGLTQEYRCAMYYDPGTYPPLRAKLMETVIREEGGANIRWFEDPDQAEAWLTQDTADPGSSSGN